MTYTMPQCRDCGPGYRIGDEGCRHKFSPSSVIRYAYVERVTTSYDWEGFLDFLTSELLGDKLHDSNAVDKAQIEALSSLQRHLMMGQPGMAIGDVNNFLKAVNDAITFPAARWESKTYHDYMGNGYSVKVQYCEWVGCDNYLGAMHPDNFCQEHR